MIKLIYLWIWTYPCATSISHSDRKRKENDSI